MKKDYIQRLNNIIGQIEGIKKMMNNEKDCFEVLTQLKAIRSALGSVMNKVIEERVDKCIKTESNKDKETIKKLLIKASE